MKDPDRRYQTAKELRNELEQLQAETASGISAPEIRFKPAKERRSASPLLVGGVVAGMALVMVAILWLQVGTGRLPASGSGSAPQVEASIAVLPIATVETMPREPSAPTSALEEKMAAALEAFDPQFHVRKAEDYSPRIRAEAASQQRQPFLLRLDVNRDGTADVVLDGHNDRQDLLLCLLSSPGGYKVVVIRESGLRAPQEVQSFNDGVRETGLNYFLWPHGTGTGFTLAFPQQSDPEGNLLNDGAIIDYTFSNGAFTESSQIP